MTLQNLPACHPRLTQVSEWPPSLACRLTTPPSLRSSQGLGPTASFIPLELCVLGAPTVHPATDPPVGPLLTACPQLPNPCESGLLPILPMAPRDLTHSPAGLPPHPPTLQVGCPQLCSQALGGSAQCPPMLHEIPVNLLFMCFSVFQITLQAAG